MRPADLGFAMPAESAPHAGCWLAWPKRYEFWGAHHAAACADTARVANTIARFEPVTMVADPPATAAARALCDPGVRILALPLDDSWLRDTGPTYVVDARGGRAAAVFTFNSWGGKYHPFDQDALLGARIAAAGGDRVFTSDLVIEGGGFYSDGDGTLITAETCVLNANRNPGLSKARAEAELCRMLGMRKVVWVPGDVTDTVTDGHVDGFLAVIRPAALLLEEVVDPADPRHRLMAENRRALELATDARGRSFEFVGIAEAPRSVAPVDATGYCRSYVNFYLANGAVIVPKYGIPEDASVVATLARCYPERQIVPVALAALFRGGGGIHCITQQEPPRRVAD
jgi:agmatine deiminase